MTDAPKENVLNVNLEEGSEMLTLARSLVGWHDMATKNVAELQEKLRPGFKVVLGDDPKTAQEIVLSDELARGAKIGMLLASIYFGQFPLKLTPGPAAISSDGVSDE